MGDDRISQIDLMRGILSWEPTPRTTNFLIRPDHVLLAETSSADNTNYENNMLLQESGVWNQSLLKGARVILTH